MQRTYWFSPSNLLPDSSSQLFFVSEMGKSLTLNFDNNNLPLKWLVITSFGIENVSSSSKSSDIKLHWVTSKLHSHGKSFGTSFKEFPSKVITPQIFKSTSRWHLLITSSNPVSVTFEHQEMSMLCRYLQLRKKKTRSTKMIWHKNQSWSYKSTLDWS